MEVLKEARESVANERSAAAVRRLEQIYETLCAYGVEQYVSFDLGMLSKYHYYTGVIMRAYTYGVGDAVMTGGRYDKLLGHFGRERPAVGFMVVIDSLMAALSRQNAGKAAKAGAAVITYRPDTFVQAVAQARERRQAGEWIELIPEAAE